MVNNLSFTPGKISEPYTNLLLEHIGCRQEKTKQQLLQFLTKGGNVASYATEDVGRDVLWRALKRFDEANRFVCQGWQLMENANEK